MTGKLHNKAEKCRIVVLCADNGVCDEGVSCTPQSVTLAQTINLTRGLTGASSLAKHFGDEVVVVDVGVMSDYNCPAVINRKIAYGTKNLYLEPAMTREEAEKAICVGLEMADFYRLYGKEKIENAILYAKDLKDRYTVLWLYYDLFGRTHV